MKKTLKIRHNQDLTEKLRLAYKVAYYAINNRDNLSTKNISHLGLNSHISTAILWKYGRNKKLKKLHSVNLIVKGTDTRYVENKLYIVPLKIYIDMPIRVKPLQMEIDKEYAYIPYEVEEKTQYKPKKHIGVDLNTTGHAAVVAVQETGKVYKLGKKATHIHSKYRMIRKNLQKRSLFKTLKTIKNKESRIIRDLNHKISRFIVDLAVKKKGGVQLEKLQGIGKSRKGHKSFKYALHSWSYSQLAKFIEYKALLAGVPLTYVEPHYSSKVCSKCGLIGQRNSKVFMCVCGHVEHADANAAFNLCKWSNSIARSYKDRDLQEGNTVSPQTEIS